MKKININNDWYFTKDDIENQPTWTKISLPHTWNNIDGQDGGSDYYRSVCHYRKSLRISDISGALYLEFEGANSVSTVYFNGILLGTHKGGYSKFRFDISGLALIGENHILVSVDNSHHEEVFPLMADFTFYGGLYRDVFLIQTNTIAFYLMDEASDGVYVFQDDVTSQYTRFRVKSMIFNRDISQTVDVLIRLNDAKSKTVLSDLRQLPVKGLNISEVSLVLENPHLWQGIDDPYLYTLTVSLIKNNMILDSREIAIGFRKLLKTENGLFLNGKKIRLNGVSRHQDIQGYGNCLTKSMMEEDIKQISKLGANAIRLAHYQHHDYFYELCDRYGFMVWAEIPFISRGSKTDTLGLNAHQQLKELILQNMNHSSIVIWGIQNEITAFGKNDGVENVVISLVNLAKTLDQNRLTVQAQLARQPIIDSIHTHTDLLGYNLYFGWYMGKVEDFDSWLSHYEHTKPNELLAISEYGVEAIVEYHSDQPQMQDYTEEYQAIWHEKSYSIFSKYDFIWGTFVWNMYDFASDFRESGEFKGKNFKGLVTFDHKVLKDAYYFYQAKWLKTPMLHITSKRFKYRHQRDIILKVYSNQHNIQVSHNGVSISQIFKDDVVFTAPIHLELGKNEIIVKANGLVESVEWITVDQPVLQYTYQKQNTVNNVFGINPSDWIDTVSNEDALENIKPDYFSIYDTIHEVINHPEAKQVFNQYFHSMDEKTTLANIRSMSIKMITSYNSKLLPKALMVALNKALQKIKK
ncbi:hypothetical protein N7548_00285 [Acholeplasma manati]|uniref:Beta-galactosidase n=1 Tax=Paracholeplasma manati TaxID=591373 RepID=A0ABT2Y3F1_9MOLU|nr:glycoside hydrolase family 2 TIM barrel-domain containing protein [Paracholeplasma manati]MCV2231263.1 hypothetical protein [Paracholeplasma manati]